MAPAAAKKAPRTRAVAKSGGKPAPEVYRRLAGAAAALGAEVRRRAVLSPSVTGEDGSSGQASTYFTNVEERTDLEFVRSGAAIMDAALGGGYVLGRVVNIVGDKSAGKTLLAIEACANFNHTYSDGHIRYNEKEAAFDQKYAEALGLPEGRVDFKGRTIDPKDEAKLAELREEMKDKTLSSRELEKLQAAAKKLEDKGIGKAGNTIEALYDDIVWTLDQNPGRPILYVIDSLDALSDEAENERAIGDASFGGSKPKKMGELFRRLIDRIEKSRMLLIVISQLRDKIGVTFGEKQTRSGGRALDYYASHIIWLSEVKKLSRVIGGIQRITGVQVRLRVKKNKVGLPFRECEYPILFGYGVDDLTANVEWLIEVKADKCLDEVGLSRAGYKVSVMAIRNRGGDEARVLRDQLRAIVWREWQRIEAAFMPQSRKY